MTENQREEVGWVQKNEASPVLALMVQMRLGERMGERAVGLEGREDGEEG